MDRSRIGLLAAGVLTCAVVGCGGDSDDEGASATTTTVEVSTTTAQTTATTAGAAPTTKAPGVADVDLRFTGTYVLQIKGKRGVCTGTGGTFAFSLTGKEVDGIGEEFAVRQVASGSPVTWKIDSTNAYEGSTGATFSSAGTSVQLDADLQRVGGPSGAPARPEHIAGTVTCP